MSLVVPILALQLTDYTLFYTGVLLPTILALNAAPAASEHVGHRTHTEPPQGESEEGLERR